MVQRGCAGADCKRPPNKAGLVALDEVKVVGFLIYCTDENSRVAELSWVAVRQGLHRKGIGRALMSALEEALAQ